MRFPSLALFLALCSFGSEASAVLPSFPQENQVSRLAVSGNKVITDRAKIVELFSQLGQIKSGWSYTWHTYPSPKAKIKLVDTSGQTLCRLDIGPNWVGSDCGVELKSNWPPLVTISKDQAQFFRDFVGGTWAVK